MRAAAAIVLALLVWMSSVRPASACDPDWDWCGWRDPEEWSPPAEVEERWSPPSYDDVDEPEPLAPAPWLDVPEYVPWEPPAAYDQPAPVERAYEPAAREVAADGPRDVEPPARIDPIVEPVPPSSARLDRGVEAEPPVVVPNKWEEAARIGAHRVTDAYAGDTVTRNGRTRTWATTTVHEEIDTVARIVADVGTGEASGLEGVLWNGRARRADGSFVRGTIYENFVWNGETWVHDKFVFFQDDSETDPLETPPVPVSVPPVVTVLPMPAPLAVPPPAVAAPPAAPPPPSAMTRPPAAAQPPERQVGPDPVTSAAAAPAAAPVPPSIPAPHDIRAGIALAPEGDALAAIEVLRGRAVRLWPRALVDGAPARVSAWRLRAGELTALGPVAGRGDVPLVAMWEQVSTPGAAFPVAVDVDVEAPGGARTIEATIAVAVRSPALVE